MKASMCAALDNVTDSEWDEHKAQLSRQGKLLARWGGGIGVLSFFLLTFLAGLTAWMANMSSTGAENSRALITVIATLDTSVRDQNRLSSTITALKGELEVDFANALNDERRFNELSRKQFQQDIDALSEESARLHKLLEDALLEGAQRQ